MSAIAGAVADLRRRASPAAVRTAAHIRSSAALRSASRARSCPSAVDRHAGQQPDRGRRRHRKHAVGAAHRSAADVQRRRDHVVDAEPLERVHRADDVDDRVERADLVQMHPLDRRVVDGGFGLRPAARTGGPRDPVLPRTAPSGAIGPDDLRRLMMARGDARAAGSCVGVVPPCRWS